jgi:beta-galactosidase/beta-glucuronidase
MWTSLSELFINVTSASGSGNVNVSVLDQGSVVGVGSGAVNTVITITVSNPTLWTPSTPYLYNLSIVLDGGLDEVGSYIGFRTFTLGKDSNNVTRPLLNGQFLFLSGWLDQGYVFALYFVSGI